MRSFGIVLVLCSVLAICCVNFSMPASGSHGMQSAGSAGVTAGSAGNVRATPVRNVLGRVRGKVQEIRSNRQAKRASWGSAGSGVTAGSAGQVVSGGSWGN